MLLLYIPLVVWLILASILFFPSLFIFLKKKDKRYIITLSAGLFNFVALLITFLFSQLLQINFYQLISPFYLLPSNVLWISMLIGCIIYWKMGGKVPTTKEWLESSKTLMHFPGRFGYLIIMGIIFGGAGVYLLFMDIFWWGVIFRDIFWWVFWWGIIIILIGVSLISLGIYFRKRTKGKGH